MLRRFVLAGMALSFTVTLSGCIGSSDLLDTVDTAESGSTDGSNIASAILESLVSNPGAAASQPSRRDVAVRVADLLVTASDPSETEQVAWDVVSAGLTAGRNGMRDSLMALLFSPLAEGVAGGLANGE